MTNFTIQESDYNDVPSFLLVGVSGFRACRQYKLLSDELKALPGLVCAAFAGFFTRLQEDALQRSPSATAERSLEDAYSALETLSSSTDGQVQNLVQVEFFENLQCDDATLTAMCSRMGPNSKRLYEDWLARNC